MNYHCLHLTVLATDILVIILKRLAGELLLQERQRLIYLAGHYACTSPFATSSVTVCEDVIRPCPGDGQLSAALPLTEVWGNPAC